MGTACCRDAHPFTFERARSRPQFQIVCAGQSHERVPAAVHQCVGPAATRSLRDELAVFGVSAQVFAFAPDSPAPNNCAHTSPSRPPLPMPPLTHADSFSGRPHAHSGLRTASAQAGTRQEWKPAFELASGHTFDFDVTTTGSTNRERSTAPKALEAAAAATANDWRRARALTAAEPQPEAEAAARAHASFRSACNPFAMRSNRSSSVTVAKGGERAFTFARLLYSQESCIVREHVRVLYGTTYDQLN